MKNTITKKMILECYEAYKSKNKSHCPVGMNENSAKMMMLWLDSLFSGKSYHRDGSCLQYEIILQKIKEDFGEPQLQKAKGVLHEHCEWSLKYHNKPMKSHLKILEKF